MPMTGGDDEYARWNKAIAEHVFRPDRAGRAVVLFFTEESIELIGAPFGCSFDDFKRTVVGGEPERIARRLLRLAHEWRERCTSVDEPPPYLAGLALLSLAAGTDEADLADHNYYTRLWRLMGVDREGAPGGFDRLSEALWDDLEIWSSQDMDGSLGLFRKRIFGEMRHVGVPRFQMLLTEHEITALRGVFYECELDPASDHTDLTISRALISAGSAYLRPRTISIVKRSNEDHLRIALLDAVHDELREWDGLPAPIPGMLTRPRAFLRLCLQLDGMQSRWSLRVHIPKEAELPEEGLEVELGGPASPYNCEGLGGRWTSRLTGTDTRELFDPTSLDWRLKEEFSAGDSGWSLLFKGSPVRVFQDGRTHGLPGWVEVERLPHSGKCYLAADDETKQAVEDWAESGCGKATPVRTGAIPGGWNLFELSEITDPGKLSDLHPALGWTRTHRVRLLGGLRTGRGDRFVGFLPPSVVVDGPTEGLTLLAEYGNLEEMSPAIHEFSVPPPLGQLTELCLMRESDGEIMYKKRIRLADEEPLREVEPLVAVGRDGLEESPGQVSGATVDGEFEPQQYKMRLPLPAGGHVMCIGRKPGQIARWPDEPLPEWEVVWLRHSGRRRRQLVFVGNSCTEEPFAKDSTTPRAMIKQWKRTIWVGRMRIVPPTDTSEASLWNLYLKAAQTC